MIRKSTLLAVAASATPDVTFPEMGPEADQVEAKAVIEGPLTEELGRALWQIARNFETSSVVRGRITAGGGATGTPAISV